MRSILTKYGALEGVSHVEYYEGGSVKECMVIRENRIATPYGLLIPQYEQDGVRRKYTKSLSFHENGTVKSISLQEQTAIKTSIGVFPAELVTFYASGAVKRLFPLNGKITGYWTEENEYGLAQEFEFSFPFGSFRKKIIGVHFYESGAIRSLTFWPRDSVTLQTPLGEVTARIGIALYPEGGIKSIEPYKPVTVDTPIGNITAFDRKAAGIHGDTNSLGFYEDGKVRYVTTSSDRILVKDSTGREKCYEPALKPSLLQVGKLSIEPLQIRFFDGKVQLGGETMYDIGSCIFTIESSERIPGNACSECSGCDACG